MSNDPKDIQYWIEEHRILLDMMKDRGQHIAELEAALSKEKAVTKQMRVQEAYNDDRMKEKKKRIAELEEECEKQQAGWKAAFDLAMSWQDKAKTLEADNAALKNKTVAEYERGVIDGKSTQALLELKGQDRFLESVPKDIQQAHKTISRLQDQIAAIRSANRWRPASEPPDTRRPVLIIEGKKYGIGYWHATTGQWVVTLNDQIFQPDHWRELPTPEDQSTLKCNRDLSKHPDCDVENVLVCIDCPDAIIEV